MRLDGSYFQKWLSETPERLYAKQPLSRVLGETFERLDGARADAVATFTIPESHCNYTGRIHGGIVTLLLDEVAGVAAAIYVGDRFRGTAEISVNFLRPVWPGPARVEARIENETPTALFMIARLFNPECVVAALATVKIAVTAPN
jgi:uncharacterized protein (TIGR00369 family)